MHGPLNVKLAVSYSRTLNHSMTHNLWAICQQKFSFRFYILRVATLLKIHVHCGLMNIYCIKLKQTC